MRPPKQFPLLGTTVHACSPIDTLQIDFRAGSNPWTRQILWPLLQLTMVSSPFESAFPILNPEPCVTNSFVASPRTCKPSISHQNSKRNALRKDGSGRNGGLPFGWEDPCPHTWDVKLVLVLVAWHLQSLSLSACFGSWHLLWTPTTLDFMDFFTNNMSSICPIFHAHALGCSPSPVGGKRMNETRPGSVPYLRRVTLVLKGKQYVR